MNYKALKNAGIDYESGIKRFMDDKELYEAVLMAFLQDDLVERAEIAYEAKDMKCLYNVAHEAKGASGNADFKNAYESACDLVAILKKKDIEYQEVKEEYKRFISEFKQVKYGIIAAFE